MNKKSAIIFSVLTVVLIGIVYIFMFYIPKQKAEENFNRQLQIVKKSTRKLEDNVVLSEKYLKNKQPVFEETTEKVLNSKVNAAKQLLNSIPSLPKNTKEIEKATDKLKTFPSTESASIELMDSLNNYKKSVEQQKQITNPSSNVVIAKLKGVSSISDTQAATEDNDTNGNLNKPGGYTAAIVFSSPLVNEEIQGKDLIDKGTDAGGTIEVYANSEEANKRNEYLKSYDGNSFLNSGSHKVIGTLVIRTSSKLTNSQQKNLEKEIESALTSL